MERLVNVIKRLKDLNSCEMVLNLRQRYATMEQWKVEGGSKLKRQNTVEWLALKAILCEHRVELERDAKRFNGDLLVLIAAYKVIDKKVEDRFEDVLCNKNEQD